jgi:hypothetical protein
MLLWVLLNVVCLKEYVVRVLICVWSLVLFIWLVQTKRRQVWTPENTLKCWWNGGCKWRKQSNYNCVKYSNNVLTTWSLLLWQVQIMSKICISWVNSLHNVWFPFLRYTHECLTCICLVLFQERCVIHLVPN